MRDDLLLKLQRIIEGKDRITWELFPAIYEGFLEADELSLAEDRMLRLIAEAVQTCTNDKIISTASSDKVAEYEDAFGLPSEGFTLEQRRQNVIDYINRSRVFNEVTLHELVLSLSDDEDVHERVDCENLTLGVFSEDEDGRIDTQIIDGIRAIVPQNLALYSGTDTTFSRPIVVSHANFSALSCGLGLVEKIEPPLMGYIVLNPETGAILGASNTDPGYDLARIQVSLSAYAVETETAEITVRVNAVTYDEVPEMVVYVPTVVELPEVTFANDTSAGNWITPRSGDTVSINADSVVEGYYWTGSAYQPTTYNSSKVYAAIEWFTSGNTFAGRVEFQFVNYNGTIGIKNNTSGTLVFDQAHLAACHSSDATVVPVYDSSNNAYNAFKYTTNNTDYYYVLDGTQTDWTDDLSAIGYSLTPQVKVAYMTRSGASATSDTEIIPSVMYRTSNVIYDSLGSEIVFDNTKTYTFSAAYNKAGDLVSSFGGTPEIGQYFSSGLLGFGVFGNGGTSRVFRIEYTES